MTNPLVDRSSEAIERRHARARLHEQMRRTGRDCDLLAERERVIKLWKKWAETNPAHRPHDGKWWGPFARNPAWRRVVLPKTRAVLDARDKAWEEQLRAEMRAYGQRRAQERAERDAAKARAKEPQKDLFA